MPQKQFHTSIRQIETTDVRGKNILKNFEIFGQSEKIFLTALIVTLDGGTASDNRYTSSK